MGDDWEELEGAIVEASGQDNHDDLEMCDGAELCDFVDEVDGRERKLRRRRCLAQYRLAQYRPRRMSGCAGRCGNTSVSLLVGDIAACL